MIYNLDKGLKNIIRSKVALISSVIILIICMCLFFPYPNNRMIDVTTTFMSFPIINGDGYISLGLIGSGLFIIAMILLVMGMKKYHYRSVLIVLILYTIMPTLLITAYQETFANGIAAISYNGNGDCEFELIREDVMNGECNFVLHNRSNETVTFELEFIDSYIEDDTRMESLMNLAGPYHITLNANDKQSFQLKKSLDLSNVSNHIYGGTSYDIHFKLIEGEKTRIF